MIALIKYKAGNIASVSNALDRLGADYFLAENPEQLDTADGVIFPGVGHAWSAMESLKENGIDPGLVQLLDHALQRRHLLGRLLPSERRPVEIDYGGDPRTAKLVLGKRLGARLRYREQSEQD